LSPLRESAETASFLSNGTVKEEEWTEKDAAWQSGCVLLALACGKSPFQRDSLSETTAAIEKCDADLAAAGALKEACEKIVGAMKNAKDLAGFKEKLGQPGKDQGKCTCAKNLF